jgi:CHRD domain
MTRRNRLLAIMAAAAAGLAVSATGSAATPDQDDRFGGGSFLRVELSGYQEDPLVLSTAASGQFRVQVNERAQEINWRLSYADLTDGITQAHIHLGGRSQSGGISVFLCTNAGNGPVGTPLCPAAPATITGTIRPADVIGPVPQGIAAGEFAELVRAIRAGVTYVNVHSTARPAGEIRAQLDHHH